MPRRPTQPVRASGVTSSHALSTSNLQTLDNSTPRHPSGSDLPANASVESVKIIASDLRTLTGKLVHHDQTPNLVLSHTIERIFANS